MLVRARGDLTLIFNFFFFSLPCCRLRKTLTRKALTSSGPWWSPRFPRLFSQEIACKQIKKPIRSKPLFNFFIFFFVLYYVTSIPVCVYVYIYIISLWLPLGALMRALQVPFRAVNLWTPQRWCFRAPFSDPRRDKPNNNFIKWELGSGSGSGSGSW